MLVDIPVCVAAYVPHWDLLAAIAKKELEIVERHVANGLVVVEMVK